MLIPLDQLIREHSLTIKGVVHAGAHTGEEAEAYHTAGVSDVWWIEGNSDVMPELLAHVKPYGHRVIHALLADVDGVEMTLNITDNAQSSSILEFGTHAIVSPDVHSVDKQVHRTKTLDTLVVEHGITGCNFLNMDLQGVELMVLLGGRRLLDSMDALYLEINVDELYKDCARLPQLDQWLAGRGFRRVATAMAGDAGWGDALYTR